MKTFRLGAKVATLTQISQALSDLLPKLKPASAVPPGMIMSFPGTTIPDGWLLCNGAAVSRTIYATLFAAIGTKYGTGDGSTTFNLPNLAGRFIEGTTSVVDVGKTYSAGLPNISGTFTEHGNTSGMQCTGAFTGEARINLKSNQGGAWDGGRVTLNSSRTSAVYGAASTVQPPAIALLPCIKI